MKNNTEHNKLRTAVKRAAVLRWVLLCVSAVVFIFSAFTLVKTLHAYKTDRDEYTALQQMGPAGTAMPQPTPQAGAAMQPSATTQPLAYSGLEGTAPTVDFDALRQINPDIVGWISVDGTTISYPIVQGSNNDYYLHRSFERRSNGAGCLFLDYRNSAEFADDNSVIYGHNMNDGSMFHQLISFKKRAFWEESGGIIRLYTPQKTYTLQIFRTFVTSDWPFVVLDFESDEKREAYLKKGARIQLYDTGIVIEPAERILTLSTCTYEYDDARFVVQAKFLD